MHLGNGNKPCSNSTVYTYILSIESGKYSHQLSRSWMWLSAQFILSRNFFEQLFTTLMHLMLWVHHFLQVNRFRVKNCCNFWFFSWIEYNYVLFYISGPAANSNEYFNPNFFKKKNAFENATVFCEQFILFSDSSSNLKKFSTF